MYILVAEALHNDKEYREYDIFASPSKMKLEEYCDKLNILGGEYNNARDSGEDTSKYIEELKKLDPYFDNGVDIIYRVHEVPDFPDYSDNIEDRPETD